METSLLCYYIMLMSARYTCTPVSTVEHKTLAAVGMAVHDQSVSFICQSFYPIADLPYKTAVWSVNVLFHQNVLYG